MYPNICKSHTIIHFAMTHFEQCVLNTTLVCELLVSKINDRESSFLGKHKTISEPFLNVLDQVRPIVSNLDDHVSENFNRIIFQLIFGVNHKNSHCSTYIPFTIRDRHLSISSFNFSRFDITYHLYHFGNFDLRRT